MMDWKYTRETGLSFPAPHLSVVDQMLSFVNNKLMSWYSVLLPKMVRFHQVVTWLHIPTFLPSHNILYTMLQFSGVSSSLTPALSLSFSFGCHLWHLQSQNRLTYLLYQCSKKWLTSSHYFVIIIHRNLMWFLLYAGPNDVFLHLGMVRFPGSRFQNFLYILLITKIQICLWSYKSFSDEIMILIQHKYCYY